jgi:hypothetical protein
VQREFQFIEISTFISSNCKIFDLIMQEQPHHDVRYENGNPTASAPKRKPPKLRPPKLRKGPTSDLETNSSSGHKLNGEDLAKSNFPSTNAGSSSIDQTKNDQQPPSAQAASEGESQKQRTRHHRRGRRVSTESQDSYQDQAIDREQRDTRSPEQRVIQERRVSQIVNPPDTQGQIERAGELAPTTANGAVEQVTETTQVQPQPPKNDQLKLRLDLNLDVEVELKAKIRGDLTLQLLYVLCLFC